MYKALCTDFSTVEWLTAAAPGVLTVSPELFSTARSFQVLSLCPSLQSLQNPNRNTCRALATGSHCLPRKPQAAAPSSRSGMRLTPHACAVRQPPRRRRSPPLGAGTLGKAGGSAPRARVRSCFRSTFFFFFPPFPCPKASATATIHFSLRCPFVPSDGPTLGHVKKENRIPTKAAIVARPPPSPKARSTHLSAAPAASEVVSPAAPAPSAARARARPAHGALGLAAAATAAAAVQRAAVVPPLL